MPSDDRRPLAVQREILILSPYPGQQELRSGVSYAVAAYTRDLVGHLLRYDPALRVTVLADAADRSGHIQSSGRLTIRRQWAPRHLRSFVNLGRALRPTAGTSIPVLVQFELAMFGGPLYGLLFVLFLLCLRLGRRRIVLVLHNFVTQPSSVRGQLCLPVGSPLPFLYAVAVRVWRRLLNHLVSESIVLEPAVAAALHRGGFKRRVSIIPHGVRADSPHDACEDTRPFFQLLLFGFPGWYKGTDLVVRWFGDSEFRAALPRSSQLLVAGSPNPIHTANPRYRAYLQRLAERCDEVGATYRSSVRSDEIADVFGSADLVVMPYRVLVGGSGVFPLAIEHGVPFALSTAVRPWLYAADVAEALRAVELGPQDFVFEDATGLAAIARRAAEPDRRVRIGNFAARLAEERTWPSVAHRYHGVLFGG